MYIKRTLSIAVVSLFMFSLLFLASANQSHAGFGNLPGGPPCCEAGGVSCIGGETALAACLSTRCQLGGDCEFIENAMCVVDDNQIGTCSDVPDVSEVPTLSVWGLIATAAILGIIGFFVIRRKKATA